jgi:hypothetical protein
LFRLFPFAHLQHISSKISPIGCNRQTLVRPRRAASARNYCGRLFLQRIYRR